MRSLETPSEPIEETELQELGRSESTNTAASMNESVLLRKSLPAAVQTRNRQSLEILKYFDPGWFAMTMGTGGTALVIGQIPLEGLEGLKYIGLGMWLFNCALFTTVLTLFTLRFVVYPEQFLPFMKHPVKPFLLGCMPMGMVTCINGIVNYGPLIFDAQTGYRAAEVLFWINTVLSIAVLVLVPFFMFTKHAHSMESMTAVWLLPIVACEVAGTCGALVASKLPVEDTVSMTMASLMNWAFSVPIALGILVILFLRLALHKLPPSGMGVTCMLALGPLGTGSLTIQLVGDQLTKIVEHKVVTAEGFVHLGQIAQGVGVGMGVIFWTMCTWWAIIALFTASYIALTSELPFNQGWWGFTFPVAVYTLSTNHLYNETELEVFRVFGVGLSTFLAIMYFWVFSLTLRDVISGRVFIQAKPPNPDAAPPVEKFSKREQISIYVNRTISFTNGLCFSVFNPVLYLAMGKPNMVVYGVTLFAFGATGVASNLLLAFCTLKKTYFRFKVTYLFTSMFLVAGGLTYSLGQSETTTVISRIFFGIAVGSHTCTKSFAQRMSTPRTVSYEQNMLTTSTTLGYVLSPLIVLAGSFIDFQFGQFSVDSETVPGYIISIIGLVCFFFVLLLLEEPADPTDSEIAVENVKEILKQSVSFSSCARFISFFGVGVYEMGIPVTLVESYGYDVREISFIFLIYAFSSAASALFSPFLLRRVDFRKCLIFSTFMVMTAFLVLISSGSISITQIVICSVIMGFGCVLLAETSAALVAMVVSRSDRRPLYTGVYVSIGYLGRALAGLWVGLTHGQEESGHPVYYGVAGLVCLVLIGGLLRFKSLSQVVYSKDN